MARLKVPGQRRGLCSRQNARSLAYDSDDDFEYTMQERQETTQRSGHPTRAQTHACTLCRRSKVRCMVNTLDEQGKCRRCYERNTECVFEAIAPRRRRQRTDTRLISLEKQVDNLKTSLNHNRPGKTLDIDRNATNDSLELLEGLNPSTTSRQPETLEEPSRADMMSEDEVIPGYLAASLLSYGNASKLFTDFATNILPHHPLLPIDDRNDFVNFREQNPLVCFAIITAASRSEDPILFNSLHSNLLRVLSEKVVINGEKSIELMQAILIMEVWYNPPKDTKHINFYMWLCIMSCMALQEHLWWNLPDLEENDFSQTEKQNSLLERWRMAFAAYLSMSTVSISLQRPRLANFIPKAQAQLDFFSAHATHHNDKGLAAWLRLQILAERTEEIRISILEDSTHSISPLAEGLQTLEDDFASYRHHLASVMIPSLQVQYWYYKCKLFELMMLVSLGRVSADPGTPQDNVSISLQNSIDQVINTAYAKATMNLLQACHSILETILSSDVAKYLRYPTVTTIRGIYALRVLWTLKQNFAGSVPGLKTTLLDENTVSFDYYWQRLKGFLEEGKGPKNYQIPNMALQVVYKMDPSSYRLRDRNINNSITSNDMSEAHDAAFANDDLEQGTTPSLNTASKALSTARETPSSSDLSQPTPQFPTSLAEDRYNDSHLFRPRSEFDLMTMPYDMSVLEDPYWSFDKDML